MYKRYIAKPLYAGDMNFEIIKFKNELLKRSIGPFCLGRDSL